jgi:hypothetical protein
MQLFQVAKLIIFFKTVSCISNGSRPAATIQWTIGQTDITLYSTTDKTHVTDDDTYTLISTLTYNADRTYNGETITCKAVNIVVPNGAQTSTSLDVTMSVRFAIHGRHTSMVCMCAYWGSPKVNFQHKCKKKLSYRIIRIKRIFFRSLLMYNLDQVTHRLT